MSSKKFKKAHDVDNIRDALTARELSEINRLQIIDTGLIEINMDYDTLKHHLIQCHQRELVLLNAA